LARVIVALMNDDTELYKQCGDNKPFKRRSSDTVFNLAYETIRLRSRPPNRHL
jgi:hypothetical protein